MSQNKLPLPTKAIIPAAGFGTRFLPQTKAIPKEMMPLIDKPIIQYVVEELVEAGIKDIIIVGNSSKRTIEDHFDIPSEDLLSNLRAGGDKKAHLIKQVEEIANLANFIYIRQKGPYGNAAPLLCAAHLIGNEPFIYKYADDFFVSEPGSTTQLIETYRKHGGSVLACKKVESDSDYDKYGIVAGQELESGVMKMSGIDEKPGKEKAKSDLASVSSYLFTPDILERMRQIADDFDGQGELMIQPAIQQMINDGLAVYAREIKNGRYRDTGDKLEYLKTVISFGLDREDLREPLLEYMIEKIGRVSK